MNKIIFFLIFSWSVLLDATENIPSNPDENETAAITQSANQANPEQKKFITRVKDGVQNAYASTKTYVTDKIQTISDTIKKHQDDAAKVVVIRNHRRLKRWMFNKNFRKDKSKKDILYHTFHPIANYFIEKYGKQKEYIAENFQGLQYSLKGLIEYSNNRIIPVIFTITKNQKGSWYHRGIIFLSKKHTMVPNGPYTSRIMHYKFGNKGMVREIVYFESSSWIKIYDAANDVTLYLKKDDFL